jgi:hypothetical protein
MSALPSAERALENAWNYDPEPQHDPLCSRCGSPSGPEGAWCDDCIRVCREHTLRLDLARLPELNAEKLEWAAIFYARAGIPAFPLKPKAKEPATVHGVDDATTNLRTIRTWWQRNPNCNIGLACGVLFDVLDIDVKAGAPGMESLAKLRRAGLLKGAWAKATTPSGGLHLLFAPGSGSNHVKRDLGVDFKTHGGYIVAAPSVTDDGVYAWQASEPDRRGATFDWEPAMRALGVIRPAPRQPFTEGSGNAEGLIRTVAEAQEGERNARLYWAACRAVDDSLDPEILRAPALAAGLSDSEISRTLASAVRGAAA